jgi:hypothetical protein
MEPLMRGPALDLKGAITDRMAAAAPFGVWTPIDFVDLGPYEAVRQALHRLVQAQDIRRITRGLYDKPGFNKLTGKTTNPDPRAVVDTLARRDQARILVDGITAANDLGLSDAVPARIVVHTDARFKPLDLGGLRIEFKKTAPSALYWAGRPAMRVVQALHWLQDMLPSDAARVKKRLQSIFADPHHGPAIVADLREGLSTLPIWMQVFLRDLIGETPDRLADAGDHHGSAGDSRRGDDGGDRHTRDDADHHDDDRHRRRRMARQPVVGQ